MSLVLRCLTLLVLTSACSIQISAPNDTDVNGSGGTRLPAPSGLASISLDGAVQLSWSGSIVSSYPRDFRYYRVHSTSYDAATGRCDDAGWVAEGTTVSDGFLTGNLQNGVSMCLAVSTVAQDGGEGPRSAPRVDTPRYGGHFVVIDALDARTGSSGWWFQEPASTRIGVVTDGSRTDVDFRIERHTDGSLWFRPVRTTGRLLVYGNVPLPALSSLDRAPSTGYTFAQAEVVPGYVYAFSTVQPDGVHYGAVRVAFAGATYVVIDWAYQSAPNNIELTRM